VCVATDIARNIAQQLAEVVGHRTNNVDTVNGENIHGRNIPMKRTTLPLVGIIAASCVAAAALAGAKYAGPTTIYTDFNLARGQLGYTYNSSNTTEAIGCTTDSSGGFTYAYCWAMDAFGTYRGCLATDPQLIDTIRALNGDSQLNFNWDAAGICTRISVDQFSYSDPKK
jgi:hypothetical protein